MYRFAQDAVDLDELRARLRKMSEASPVANLGQPPREPFVIQLREVKAEWRRRFREIS